jgi:hypothetical protein
MPSVFSKGHRRRKTRHQKRRFFDKHRRRRRQRRNRRRRRQQRQRRRTSLNFIKPFFFRHKDTFTLAKFAAKMKKKSIVNMLALVTLGDVAHKGLVLFVLHHQQ